MIPKNNEPLKKKKIGVRERSKQERQDRIMIAARKLFAEQGYDATTLRQVAEQSGLGLGTLFNYISDKRDLIYLVFNREVGVTTEALLAAPRSWQSFKEKILSMVEPNYRLFGSEPVLSRILLSEVLQHTPGLHLAEHLRIRNQFIRGMEKVVDEAQESKEIGSSERAELIARHIFFSYSAALRWWLAASENPAWRAGMRDFSEILSLQIAGLGVKNEPGKAATGVKLSASTGERGKVARKSASKRPSAPPLKEQARPSRKA